MGVRRLDAAVRAHRGKTAKLPAEAPQNRALRRTWRARLRCEGALWALAVLRREAEVLDLTDEWLFDAADLLVQLEDRARRAEIKMNADISAEGLAAIYAEAADADPDGDAARRFVASYHAARDDLRARGYDRRTE